MEELKSISILDKNYVQWVKDLSSRYRRSQIKAAVKVNQEMLGFYLPYNKYFTNLQQPVAESSSQPIGISEYELEKFYPEKLEGTIPSVEEIEEKLTQMQIGR